ncbi:cysteine protease StiP family protein [Cohnella fermenti]|uniref:Uncharacterized protein n=1 Tax=Cohnella fermenti TaxID=2565925 RepID=A0A4S4CEU8_9BACL|nr:cysteine protease StiP family protein [Cohnella fermenti]THF84535.1 hypothetical protein E6C55_00700 [Cohnella fermenti]
MNSLGTIRIPEPMPMGSYPPGDVTFLLKDLSDVRLERESAERERVIQGGGHYSESLPIEYRPTAEYVELFHKTLRDNAEALALATGTVAELILSKRGQGVVLASLARAGTPIGVLIKRYVKAIHGYDWPHYSLSIIRGKGIDENALLYIHQRHGLSAVQFVDGWTGKGAIRKVLSEACRDFGHKYGIAMNDDLAVLADPGQCAETFGTRDDYLIPSACLNATVSGLMSRTVLRGDLIGAGDFHGAKFYREWLEEDLSNLFVDEVSKHFEAVQAEARSRADRLLADPAAAETTWQGLKDIERIQRDFGIEDVNLVKPGVGETTRVLLRRVPWRILVNKLDNPELRHIMLLAKDRGVPVEVYPELTYSCCGIIKPVRGESE